MKIGVKSDYLYDLGNACVSLGYMEIEAELGHRLKKMREEQKWTQEDVAARLMSLGVSVTPARDGPVFCWAQIVPNRKTHRKLPYQ